MVTSWIAKNEGFLCVNVMNDALSENKARGKLKNEYFVPICTYQRPLTHTYLHMYRTLPLSETCVKWYISRLWLSPLKY